VVGKEKIDAARRAVLADLKRRALAGDKSVRPTDPASLGRWARPQPHYYCGSGETACPACGAGTLRYQRSPRNGHVHAACDTAGCVQWRE